MARGAGLSAAASVVIAVGVGCGGGVEGGCAEHVWVFYLAVPRGRVGVDGGLGAEFAEAHCRACLGGDCGLGEECVWSEGGGVGCETDWGIGGWEVDGRREERFSILMILLRVLRSCGNSTKMGKI